MADEYGAGNGPAPVEQVEDFGKDDQTQTVKRWIAELKAYSKEYGSWEEEVDRHVKRYREERDEMRTRQQKARRFNILWSTIQTSAPLLYSQKPMPEVSRRFKDKDPIARTASEVIERALVSLLDVFDFDSPVKGVRLDFQLAARGAAWIRYIPTYGEPEPRDPADEAAGTFRPVVDERVDVEHVHFKDFRHSPAPTWDKVTWVARRVRMTREQLKDRFGDEIGKEVPLAARATGMSEEEVADYGDVFKRAEVWEIWDKSKREVVWVCPQYAKRWLDRRKDPLKLRRFFPCPRPCYGTITGDTLIPVPDATEWQPQIIELDTLTERISLLASAVKVAGAYDASLEELIDLMDSKVENKMVPVTDWLRLSEQGGIDGAVTFLPIEQVIQAMVSLVEMRETVKQSFFEISGLADIIRGASDPTETLGAQQIKARFAGARLEDRQREIQRFVRDLLEMMAEIMSEHFSIDTIAMLSSYPEAINATPQDFAMAVKLMQDDRLRTFRIDIETDSTIIPDRQDERDKRIQLVEAMVPLLEKGTVAIESDPALKPMIAEVMMFALRGFEAGRQLEETFETYMETVAQSAGQQQEDASAAAEMQKIAIQQAKVDNDFQLGMAKIQVEQDKLLIEQAKLDLEVLKAQSAAPIDQATASAEIAERRANIEAKQRELDIKSEELLAKRDEAGGKLAIEGEKIDDARMAREAEAARDDTVVDSHAQVGDAAAVLTELTQAMAETVQALSETVATSQEAMAAALMQFTAATQAMVDASMLPKALVRDKDGRIVGSQVVAPGTETVQ